MPIEKISTNEFLQQTRRLPTAHWPSRKNPEHLYPLTYVSPKTSFSITPTDRFFCIGSCFAREIEETLDSLGFEVLSQIHSVPVKTKKTFSKTSGLHNKYNLPAILNELQWSQNSDSINEESLFYKNPRNGFWQDFQLFDAGSEPLDICQQLRTYINRYFAQIKQADVVVITLGLSEAWYDKQQARYLNVMPSSRMMQLQPDRFELHVLNYAESQAYLQQIYEQLTAIIPHEFKLVITVSPVPLKRTFRAQDVIRANSYSKSLLRTLIDEFCLNHDNVDYFPSYELATLSDYRLVWSDDDFRHVDGYFVEYIMSMFLQHYQLDSANQNNRLEIAKQRLFSKALALNTEQNTAVVQRLNWKNRLINTLFRPLSVEQKQQWFQFLLYFRRYSLKEMLTEFKLRTKNTTKVGYIDRWDGEKLHGWAINPSQLQQPAELLVLLDNQHFAEITTHLARPDVAKSLKLDEITPGFSIAIALEKTSVVSIIEKGTGIELENSPFLIEL